MESVKDLLYQYVREGLYWSSLSFAEYIYNLYPSSGTLRITIVSLYHLEFYEKAIDLIERNENLHKHYEMRKIYWHCVEKSKTRSLFAFSGEAIREENSKNTKCKINLNSLLKMYSAKIPGGEKDLHIEAYLIDTRNFEALLLLQKNELCNESEIQKLILKVTDDEIRKAYLTILSNQNQFKYAFSPMTLAKKALQLYINRRELTLLSVGTYMIKNYKRSEYSYYALGLYFLLENNYEESKKCFYKSLKMNENFGSGWIGLGISYSGLKECINALECYNSANLQMIGSNKPSLYIALESHKMNNLDQADIWYRECLKKEKNSIIIQLYSCYLISNEKYEEASKLLQYKNTEKKELYLKNGDIIKLLQCFCCLFSGNIEMAQSHLSNVKHSWKYFVIKGFINHLYNKISEATYNYHEALIRSNRFGVIEDLLAHAMDIMAGTAENAVIKYATELFEALDLRTSEIPYI